MVGGYEFLATVTSPSTRKEKPSSTGISKSICASPSPTRCRRPDAGASVTAYGEALFRQLIGSDEARETSGQLKDRASSDRLALAVIGTPAFQALHWEALKDPQAATALRLRCPDCAAPAGDGTGAGSGGGEIAHFKLAFKDLIASLAGYPLALQVVLQNLAGKSAAEVLEELRQGLAEDDVAAGT